MKSINFKWIVDSCDVVPSASNTFFHQQATNSLAMSLLWESTHSKLLANSIKFPLYFSPSQHQLLSFYLYYLRSIACVPILREFMFLHHTTSTDIETTLTFQLMVPCIIIHSFIHSLVFSLIGRAGRNQSPVM